MNKTEMEIERKFKVERNDSLSKYQSQIKNKYMIKQYYLYISNDFEKRIRMKKNLNTKEVEYRYTEKRGKGSTREEKEQRINKADYLKYLSKIKKKKLKPIVKERTVYKINNYIVEVDNYLNNKGKYKNLLVCEVEFKNKEDMKNFQPFNFMSKEITYNKKYKNSYIFKEINNLK